MNTRRNFFIRAVAKVAGDIGTGTLLAAACAWVVEAASLGIFLSFTVWILGVIAMLAISQYAVHPLVSLALSDSKLDQLFDTAATLSRQAARIAGDLWEQARAEGSVFARRPA